MRMSVEASNDDVCYEFKNVSICLIDVVGFSRWCRLKTAKEVILQMVNYNEHLTKLLTKYDHLTKIELVGDSCLVVGGMNGSAESEHVEQILCFCVDLLNSYESTFQFRIGLHIGEVFGAYIKSPTKFQLFGNDINVASRLESSSRPGVIHASKRIHDRLSGDHEALDIGPVVSNRYKGVGDVESGYITRKFQRVLVIEDLKICQHVIMATIEPFSEAEICDNIESGLRKMKEQHFTVVLMDTHFENETIYKHLQEFRLWETKYRSEVQPVIAVSSYVVNKEYQILFNELVDKSKIYSLPDKMKKYQNKKHVTHNRGVWSCFRQ